VSRRFSASLAEKRRDTLNYLEMFFRIISHFIHYTLNFLLVSCLIFSDFCRATLCVSAACAVVRCRSVGYLPDNNKPVCVSVRLSVRPSVTFVYSVETNEDISNIFSPSGSHTILVFFSSRPTKRCGNIPTGTTRTGASIAGGVGENRNSRRISGYRIDDCCNAIGRLCSSV